MVDQLLHVAQDGPVARVDDAEDVVPAARVFLVVVTAHRDVDPMVHEHSAHALEAARRPRSELLTGTTRRRGGAGAHASSRMVVFA